MCCRPHAAKFPVHITTIECIIRINIHFWYRVARIYIMRMRIECHKWVWYLLGNAWTRDSQLTNSSVHLVQGRSESDMMLAYNDTVMIQ